MSTPSLEEKYGIINKVGGNNGSRPKTEPKPRFLAAWRKYRNLTQLQLAKRTGLTQGMISHLEVGRSDYTGDLLEALAFALLCEPADLLARNPLDTEAPWEIWNTLKSGQKRRAIKELRKIADENAA